MLPAEASRIPPERRVPPALGFVLWIAAAVVLVGFAARLALDIPGSPVTPESYLGLLVAAALECGAALAVRRRETVAWILAVAASGIAALRVLGLLRGMQGALGALQDAIPSVWPWLIPTTEVVMLAAAVVAAAYAARRRGAAQPAVRRAVVIAAVGGLVAATAIALLSITRPTDIDLSRLSGRTALGFALVAAFVGAARDLSGPMRRAQARLLEQPLTRRGSTITIYGRLLRDELFPSAAEERRRAIEEERARLAADLHALVLPDLRRAAAAATASGGPGDPVAANLRSTLADVEQLIHGRQSVVLEQFGLGAALEWLAERVEERSDVRVTIEEADTSWIGVGNRTLTDNMAAARQRAAFRVALLALDNVVRHAGASTATIRFGVAPRQFLSVTDDGRGIAAAGVAGGRPGRGLADRRAEALATGGIVELRSTETGTTVEIAWGPRDAGNDATTGAGTATGMDAGKRQG
jgi:signal transduction histidine kinase